MIIQVILIMITVHGLDGREITISADEITSLHGRVPGKSNMLFVDGVNCLVHLTDGQTISVVETCLEVRDRIQGGMPH